MGPSAHRLASSQPSLTRTTIPIKRSFFCTSQQSKRLSGEFLGFCERRFLAAVDLTAARNETLVSTKWAKLRSVDYTAALSDNSLTWAVNATDCRKRSLFVLAVYLTSASVLSVTTVRHLANLRIERYEDERPRLTRRPPVTYPSNFRPIGSSVSTVG